MASSSARVVLVLDTGWELFPLEKNPISLVRVKGCSKRMREPRVLTAEEFRAVLFRLQEPVRTMACVAACLGLRASEMVGLQWSDVDWTGGPPLSHTAR